MKRKAGCLDWTLYPEFQHYLDGCIEVPHGPGFGWLETSTVCNLKCTHCFTGYKEALLREYIKDADTFLDMGLFELWCRKVLPYLHSVSLEGISGEAFLHPEIDHIVSELIKSECLPCIVTNGTIFKEKTARKIFQAGGSIGVSLDGINPETYEKIRIGAKFDHTWENILRFRVLSRKTEGTFKIFMVYQENNWFELEELIEKCLALGIEEIFINEHRNPDFCLDIKEYLLDIPDNPWTYLRKCLEKFKTRHNVFFNFASLNRFMNIKNSCSSPWIHIWTGVSGECRICCYAMAPFWATLSADFEMASFYNMNELIQVRKAILEGTIPEFCETCHLIWGINSPALNR